MTFDLDDAERRFGVVPPPKPVVPKPIPKLKLQARIVLPKKAEPKITLSHSFRIEPEPPRPFEYKHIVPEVAKAFGVEPQTLFCTRRARIWAWPRMAAYLLFTELTDWSLPRIGNHFKRDHTTILSGIRKAKRLAETDEWFRDKLTEARGKLK